MPTPAHSKSKASVGSLPDLESPGSLTLIHELVQATEDQAVQFWEELRVVKSGPEDVKKIHEIAIGCVTMILGTAVPLMHALLSDGVATKSSSMPSQLEQNAPLTQTPLARAVAPSSCTPSLENLRCVLPKPSASSLAQPKSKASDESCQPVQLWRNMAILDSAEGAASKPASKIQSSGRKICAHAPFTMRFANSLFQGRGVHALESFRRLDEASDRRQVREARLRDIAEPRRLFPPLGGDDESDPVVVSGGQSDRSSVVRKETSKSENNSVCSSSCCRGGPFLGRCRAQRKKASEPFLDGAPLVEDCECEDDLHDLKKASEPVLDGPPLIEDCECEEYLHCDNDSKKASEPVLDGASLYLYIGDCCLEDDLEDDTSQKLVTNECVIQPSCSPGLEQVVLTPPQQWISSVQVLPRDRVLNEGADAEEHSQQPASWDRPCDRDANEGADVAELLQQAASRDPGGADPLYRDSFMQQMDAVERQLRIAFKRCEDERLHACKTVGWIRTDIDWIKGASKASGMDGQVKATVHVPARGPVKLAASSSGQLTNAGIRHRRLLIAEARLLYLSSAIRQHHEGLLGKDSANELRLAAVRAILSDLPLEFLRCLSKDPRVQECAITSEKKMRKKVLREIKMEAAKARKDPMTVLKATIDHSKRAGSIKAYRGMHAILSQSGFGHCLPSDEQMAAAKKGIMRLAEADLELEETPDGYRISLKRAVEMEASRIMQEIAMTETSKLTARVVGVQPGGHGWQDLFDIKITFDARRVTRHGSQTEVMMIFLLKGEAGVDRCQKAVHHRTIAIWSGKDSKENVQRNLAGMMKEAKELEENGIVFSIAADSFLTVQESDEYQLWMELPEQTRKEKSRRMDAESFHNVGIRFWVPADMLAQCSLLGQGCAGKKYCAHCHTDKDARHIPFELRLVPELVNFRTFADQVDLHAETLWSINTCADRGPNWKFTEQGLRFMTAPCNLVIEPQPPLATSGPGSKPGSQSQSALAKTKQASGAGEAHKAAAGTKTGPIMPVSAASTMRASRKRKAQTLPAAASHAAASDATTTSNRDSDGRALGPDAERLSKLDTWRVHDSKCLCVGCAIPANTIVRTMSMPGFSRPSAFLSEHWPQMTSSRCPFCALHCLMRVTEALFQQICQFALAGGVAHLKRLNDGLCMAGFKSKKFEKLRNFDSKNYERMSFLGHESLHLLKRTDGGDRNIAVILKHIWPQGDAPRRVDQVDGTGFVARSLDLWEQWAKVVELMTERDFEKVREKRGFENFGKECRDFCFMFQAMFHKAQCKAFYLHTLMAHAGDFMRELGKHGMCLGMMSNSGAERRHEYGRRAFKRSLCGGCWAKTNPDLAVKRNLSAFLTLREVLMWQYGADLWSHEMAVRADAAYSGESTGAESTTISSRRQLVAKALANLSQSSTAGSETDGVPDRLPLLSFEEADKELRRYCDLEAPAPCLETGSEGWITVDHDKSKALEFVPFEGEWKEGEPLPPGVQKQADGTLVLQVGRVPELTNGVADWLSDCSGDGSDDCSDSDDGSCRFEDLADFESDSEDGEYDPNQDNRLSRLLEGIRTGAVEADYLEYHDAQLIEQNSDGAWQARTTVDQRQHETRSKGKAKDRASILSEDPSSKAKRQRTELWGVRDGDTNP
jgi:hypothetical protein